MPRLILITATLIGLSLSTLINTRAEDAGSPPKALELFEQRIMPIFRSPQPSSCVQCHLASVDLKDYILPSHERTFVSLRDQGLIDINHPEKSKILTLIQMGEKDLDRGAKLIHEKTRKAEYEAFVAWIKACCGDPKLASLPSLTGADVARPDRPDPVIRHTRKDRILDSFIRNVWSQRMRCFPCHTPNELDQNLAQHEKPRETHRQFVEQFGQRMNIFRQTPEETLRQLILSSKKPPKDRLPLINVEQPTSSLLLLKPLAKLPAKDEDDQFLPPSSIEPVTHMGGRKMFPDDHTYKSFLAWIQDYARVVADEYASPADLPLDNWYPTNHTLRLTDAPESWPVMTVVQLFIHAWDDKRAAWQTAPIAFTQGLVTPKRLVFGNLILLADKDKSAEWNSHGVKLPPGKYLIKAYVDSQKRLSDNPTMLLGETDYFGQAEIEAQWREGFPQAEPLSAGRLQK
jgi:hypothetical protein